MASSRIVRSSPLPFYVQLAEILRGEIERGVHDPGAMLPSEAALCEEYGISRTAVRDALRLLADDGLVRKERGRGTFVTGRRLAEILIQDVRGFVEEMSRQGRSVTTTVLDLSRTAAPAPVADALGIAVGAPIVSLDRIRLLEGEPVLRAITSLPFDRFGALVDRDLSDESLYDVLADEFDVHPVGGPRHIGALAADASTARHLGVAKGAPLLELRARNDDADGEPVEHFVAHYRPDRVAFEFTVRTDRGGHHATLGLAASGGQPAPGRDPR